MSEKEIDFRKELSRKAKIYRLGEVTSAVIKLMLENPGEWSDEMAYEKLVEKYKALELHTKEGE